MAATLAAAAAPLASQPRVFGYCRARVVRPSWRIIARGALGIEVTGEDDGEDLSMGFANITGRVAAQVVRRMTSFAWRCTASGPMETTRSSDA